MRNILFFLNCLIFQTIISGQQNCEILKNDPICYEGCLKMNQEMNHRQGSYESQELLTNAIELCPSLSNAYFEKSVAFLKRGMFIQWKELMDKAVELNPEYHLADRAWAQYAFLHNYEETIKDLNNLIELKGTSFIGVGQQGDYDLRIILAICHKLIGRKEKAIEIIETSMADSDYYVGLYDYLHLGVLYLENNQLKKSIESFQKQIEENKIAEVYFYLAKVYTLMNNNIKAKKNLNIALELYDSGRKMHSYYYEFTDQIYKKDILELL